MTVHATSAINLPGDLHKKKINSDTDMKNINCNQKRSFTVYPKNKTTILRN